MKKIYRIEFLFLLAAATVFAGCQSPSTTPTTNSANSAAPINAAANTTTANSSAANSSTAATATTIEAREPEQYQATVTIKLDTMGGQNAQSLPPLVAQVARNGADKRVEFNVPGGEKIIYLDRADKRFLLLPNRKQYAEVNQESVGVEVRDIMTPGRIIEIVRNLKTVERAGEEQFNGRTVVRYNYGAVTDTKSQAGQVQSQSYVLVDKETGLPLRSELFSQSTSGGNVQGIQAARAVAEMNNIQTNAPAELFAEPTDYNKIPPEQVRAQVTGLVTAAGAILGQLLQSGRPVTNPATSPAATTNVSPTP
jgi:hypothetical protein